MIHPVVCHHKVVVITQDWPCWLSSVVAMNLPLAAVFLSKAMQSLFAAREYIPLVSLDSRWEVPPDWTSYTVLASGTHEWFSFISTKLSAHVGPFIYATDVFFRGRRPRDVSRLFDAWTDLRDRQGFTSRVARHADFGGVTSAFHLISSRGVDAAVFCPPPALPRILAHIVNAATPDPSREIESPCPIDEPVPRAPIVRDGMLRLEGLFDVFDPLLPVACPCVFKASGWSKRSLSIKELLCVFDTPLAMDNVLLPDRRARNIMQRCITPIVVSAIFRAMWSNDMGFVTASAMAQQELTVHEESDTDETGRELEVVRVGGGEEEKEDEGNREENGWRSGWRSRPPMARVGITTRSLALSLSEPVHEHINQGPSERELFAKLKQEHDLAKAVKSDDAEVPLDLWDQAVCISPPSEVEKKALTVM